MLHEKVINVTMKQIEKALDEAKDPNSNYTVNELLSELQEFIEIVYLAGLEGMTDFDDDQFEDPYDNPYNCKLMSDPTVVFMDGRPSVYLSDDVYVHAGSYDDGCIRGNQCSSCYRYDECEFRYPRYCDMEEDQQKIFDESRVTINFT